MRPTLAAGAVALALALGATAQHATAAAITGIAITNNSSPDLAQVLANGERFREFRSSATAPTAGTTSGNAVSFDTRMAWASSHRVLQGAADVANTNGRRVGYNLSFRIEDPLSLGYSLSIDSVMRGFLTALWQGNVGAGTSQVFAIGTAMAASLDSGSGFVTLPDLFTDGEIASATSGTPFVNTLVFDEDRYSAGSFIGTRDFTLRFANPANNTAGGFQNFNFGEADVRFGLEPTLPNFLAAGYPGLDGEPASSHGHLLRVTARFNGDLPPGQVPEPGSLALLGAGLLSLAALRRKPARVRRARGV